MTKKPENYCAQTDIVTQCFVRVLCDTCDMVLPLEEDTVQRKQTKAGAVILTVSVPPFCPRCLKKKEDDAEERSYAAMGEDC